MEGAEPILDTKEEITLFNVYFNSTFTTICSIIPDDLLKLELQLSSITIDSSYVFKALCDLDSLKSAAWNNISPHTLKSCATS